MTETIFPITEKQFIQWAKEHLEDTPCTKGANWCPLKQAVYDLNGEEVIVGVGSWCFADRQDSYLSLPEWAYTIREAADGFLFNDWDQQTGRMWLNALEETNEN